MTREALFDIPTPGRFSGSYLAQVVSVKDPENQARVQIRLLNMDGVVDQDGPLWARVAVPVAGKNRGAFLIPDVGDEVLVNFINGDPRFPVVVGGLWNGSAAPPEQIGSRVDRWTLVGKAGTRIAITEEGPANATIAFTTPNGVQGTLTDTGGGQIEFRAAGTTITVDSSGVSVQTPATVAVKASQVDVTAGKVTVSACLSQFSGIIQCDALITNSVISSAYTPGAGNIW